MQSSRITKFAYILFLSVGVSFNLFGQSTGLTLALIDESTNEPIESAFVFLEGTTIGGLTDQAGEVFLNKSDIQDYVIVVTHLLYEEVQILGIDISNDYTQVKLVPKAFSLDEVIVKSKKGKSRKYKKWMKRFEDAFIGGRKVRKKVKILNPEVIWFEEKDQKLFAHAVDNIRLRNELTGYIMHVALSEFSLTDEGDITYSGSVFYDDITDQLKKPERIEKRRKEYFRHSRQLFFKSLFWKHPVNYEEYTFGITVPNADQTYAFNESSTDQLQWKRGIYADTLKMADYLTVIVNDRLVHASRLRDAGQSLRSRESSTSFLLSKTGEFIVNKNGYLLNQKDIEESGYWTSVRMAHELPKDYVGDVYFLEEEAIATIAQLQAYKSKHRPEKIYVHTDKSAYLPFEHFWFKAYLVNAVDHSLDTPSEVVYVDLVNEDGEIVKNWLLNSRLGLTGDMQWTPLFKPGTYLLRAYTNHMRNQGEHFFFEKELVLSSLQSSTDQISITSRLDTVTFYPEGGDLIQGVPSQVAYVAIDSAGNHIEVPGVIKDQNDLEVVACFPIHQGIGMFQLVPDSISTYYFETEVEGRKLRFDLPMPKASGINMSVNANDADNIYIDILSSTAEIHEDAFLIGHMRGEVFAFVNKLSQDKPLTISKSSIPPGVVHFTLFDQYERPQAERLIFNDHDYEQDIITSNTSNLTSKQHSLSFTIDSLLLDNPVDLSMSIIDEVHYPTALTEQNISSYLHLNSDLETHISGLNSYLVDIDQTKRYYLDLILRTQAWRRFTWKDLRSNQELAYAIETGYSISGKVSEKDIDKPLQSTLMITALGPEFINETTNSDHKGEFSFENLNYKDRVTYVIQARKGVYNLDDEILEVEGDRLVDIAATKKLGVPYEGRKSKVGTIQPKDDYTEDELLVLSNTYEELQFIDSSIWQIEAPEVTIRGSRGNHTSNRPGIRGLLYMDNADWIHPSTSGMSLITAVAPSRRYHFGAGGKLYATIINFYGETIRIPAQVTIDGFGAEPGTGSTSTPHRLRSLTADMIETIYVGEGVIAVTTRSIPRSVERSLESGIIHIDHPGYYQARQFSDISATIPPKLVSTVLWDPDVIFDDSGKLEVSIKEDLKKSSYVVILEGLSAQGDVISFRKVFEEE